MSDLPRLSRATANDPDLARLAALPERVLQFGGGNFVRGFADWMIDRLNRAGRFNGRIVVVQSTGGSRADALNAQDGLFTLVERGMKDGREVDRTELIASISRGLNANTQWSDVLTLARQPGLRLVVSNTTEAGIARDPADTLASPRSFPARLAAVLFERFNAFDAAGDRGLIVLPCELIEDNGRTLARLVGELATAWQLPAAFRSWLTDANVFLDTLVDRIVPGLPADHADTLSSTLGYRDELLVTAEPYHILAIQGGRAIRDELPFDQVGLNVVWTDDLTPYRERKVRILNGGHTGMALGAFLAGHDTVKQCMADAQVVAYLRTLVYDAIIPTLALPRDELERFAADVFERFANPFAQHALLSISLNSTSKFKARLLPTIRDSVARSGSVRAPLAFSLAALLAFYRGTTIEHGKLIGTRDGMPYPIQDTPAVLEAFGDHGAKPRATPSEVGRLVRDVLADHRIWQEDLNTIPGLAEGVARWLGVIVADGARAAIARVATEP